MVAEQVVVKQGLPVLETAVKFVYLFVCLPLIALMDFKYSVCKNYCLTLFPGSWGLAILLGLSKERWLNGLQLPLSRILFYSGFVYLSVFPFYKSRQMPTILSNKFISLCVIHTSNFFVASLYMEWGQGNFCRI